MSFSFSENIGNWNNPFKQTFTNIRHSLLSISVPVSSAISVVSVWEDIKSTETYIDLLDNLYTFQDYIEVSTFLKSNPFLIPILFEALGEIDNYFVDHLGLSLEVITDFETNEDKLYLKINSLMPNSYELLDALDDNWWLDILPKTRFKMNIDLEF